MMGISALWTAARYDIPCLIVVANNRSYFNDEVHQEKIALTRGRPVENKAVGQAIADPDLDFAALARAQGLLAFGPVTEPGTLVEALREALPLVQAGRPILIDARIEPGYAPEMAEGMTD
jgi:thiamine pyrophosphate-dependent acetolactate synthase large subunit-like protein